MSIDRTSSGHVGPGPVADVTASSRVDVDDNDALLVQYTKEEDPWRRAALYLDLYATRIDDGSDVRWEIPSVRADTLRDIARLLRQAASTTRIDKESVERLAEDDVMIIRCQSTDDAYAVADVVRRMDLPRRRVLIVTQSVDVTVEHGVMRIEDRKAAKETIKCRG